MPPRSQSRRRTFSEALAAGLAAGDAQLIVAHREFAKTPLGTALAKHGFAAEEVDGGGSAGLPDAALTAAAVEAMDRRALQAACKQRGIEADGTTAVLKRELLERPPAAGGGVPDTATSALTFNRALFAALVAEDGAVLEGYGALLASPLCAAL